MLSLWQFLLLLLVAFGVVFIAWRYISERVKLPCPPWLAFLVELDNPLFRNNRAATIIAGLDVKPGMRVLDVGCGPGRLTIPLAREVGPDGQVVAVDLEPRMLNRVKAKAENARLRNVELHQARLGMNQLDLGAFDRAVMVTVLGEVPNKDAALCELWAAIKPGGVLAISEVIADPHFQSRDFVGQLAQRMGFREKSRVGGKLAYTLYLERPA